MPPEQGEVVVGVGEFVALLNQTLDYAFSGISIVGELANFRVSKGKWVYFDLKDETSTVKFFGTIYNLPGPLEDGMLLKVKGTPHLHNQYGFSVNVQMIQPTGEGTIRRAAELLQAKLAAEGLFDESRKRAYPYPPERVGLIASRQSAAFVDFTKILDARWGGVLIELIDVQVQGESAPAQIVAALEQFNGVAEPPDVIVLIRGGGSAEDLAAFSTESVTRAVAASRIPTLVAIGHEVDVSLAELAADRRASTPSNAAELLVPDRAHVLAQLQASGRQLHQSGQVLLQSAHRQLETNQQALQAQVELRLRMQRELLHNRRQLINAFSPTAVLRRGYAIVRKDGHVVRDGHELIQNAIVEVQLADSQFSASVQDVKLSKAK